MAKKVNGTTKSAKGRSATKKAAEYVIPLGGTGWVVKNSEAKEFTAISDTKSEAVKIARALAKQYGRKLIVFAKDGSIQQQVSYAI
jgi:hypothetical protein